MKSIDQLREESQDMTIPYLVVLKRKSIRVFPDGTRIGLYYADGLNRMVTIPFESISFTTPTYESTIKAWREGPSCDIQRKPLTTPIIPKPKFWKVKKRKPVNHK